MQSVTETAMSGMQQLKINEAEESWKRIPHTEMPIL
jgi:hypothetical protein